MRGTILPVQEGCHSQRQRCMYTNSICKAPKSGFMLTDVGDHFGIFQCVKCKSTHSANSTIKKRLFLDNNVKLFRMYLDEMKVTHI